MSDFVRHKSNLTSYNNDESWIILSTIEYTIKNKVVKIGTPLKNWKIQINYGIKTGYNDAFIISNDIRNQLINIDPKSAEIIRPILRGRDIKRYGYDFQDLYIITTFPSLNIDIEKFPAIKKHLLSFGINRLEQTGNEHIENGKSIKARKKTNNKWFETQDSISYWEDFSKQKIIYPGIMRIAKGNQTNFPRFCFDKEMNFYFGNDCYFIVGENIEYLSIILNSSLVGYLFRYYIYSFDETGFKIFTEYFEKIPIPIPNKEMLNEAKKLISNTVDINKVNEWVYKIYNFTSEEINEIEQSVNAILNKINEF